MNTSHIAIGIFFVLFTFAILPKAIFHFCHLARAEEADVKNVLLLLSN